MTILQQASEAASRCCGDRLAGCCVAAALAVMSAELTNVRRLAACNASSFEITQHLAGLGVEP